MNDKDLVTCLETSKLLKDKGFPMGDTYFVWVEYINFGVVCWALIRDCEDFTEGILPEGAIRNNFYAAPTISELLAELPKTIRNYVFTIYKDTTDNFAVEYRDWFTKDVLHYVWNKSLPEALASLYLKVKGENERRSK